MRGQGEDSPLTPRDAPLPTLKPCPFCGAPPNTEDEHWRGVGIGASQEMEDGKYIEEGRRWTVMCCKCGASCSTSCESQAEAIAAWNRRASGWQPIAEAPKDGTHVFVGTFPAPPGAITTATAHWFDGGWALSVNYDGEHSDHGVKNPTHWMPLPEPPAAKAREPASRGEADGT